MSEPTLAQIEALKQELFADGDSRNPGIHKWNAAIDAVLALLDSAPRPDAKALNGGEAERVADGETLTRNRGWVPTKTLANQSAGSAERVAEPETWHWLRRAADAIEGREFGGSGGYVYVAPIRKAADRLEASAARIEHLEKVLLAIAEGRTAPVELAAANALAGEAGKP